MWQVSARNSRASATAPATAVLQYRLDDTAKVFTHQCGLDDKKDDVVSLDHQLDSDNALDDLLFSYAAENDPQRFVDSFDQLVAWVDSSLDLYKVCKSFG